MQFKSIRLLNACDVYQPKTIATKYFVPDGKYTVYGANGEIGQYDEYNHEEPEVLMACRGATCGTINVSKPFSWINGNAMVIHPNGTVPLRKDYLKYYLMSVSKDSIISGTAQPQITRQNLKDFQIVICDLDDQQKIVSQIEESLSQLDNAVETLNKTKQQLEIYRQAVLKEAFEGKMTASWRNKNSIAYSGLVSAARSERDKLIHKMKLRKLKYEWKDDISLPNIPDVWEYAQIGDIAWSIKDGPHYSPEYTETGVPFITGGNVRPSGVDFDSAKRISPELYEELCKRCKPEKGDMLYTKGGTTGIARLNTYDIEFSVWVHVAVIKYVDILYPEYFQHVLNSPLCYQQSQKYTHGVGNQDLGLTRMINIIFPLCSIEEQKQIVLELESRLSECENIEKTVNQSLQQAEALRQSILKQAFEEDL